MNRYKAFTKLHFIILFLTSFITITFATNSTISKNGYLKVFVILIKYPTYLFKDEQYAEYTIALDRRLTQKYMQKTDFCNDDPNWDISVNSTINCNNGYYHTYSGSLEPTFTFKVNTQDALKGVSCTIINKYQINYMGKGTDGCTEKSISDEASLIINLPKPIYIPKPRADNWNFRMNPLGLCEGTYCTLFKYSKDSFYIFPIALVSRVTMDYYPSNVQISGTGIYLNRNLIESIDPSLKCSFNNNPVKIKHKGFGIFLLKFTTNSKEGFLHCSLDITIHSKNKTKTERINKDFYLQLINYNNIHISP